MKSYQPETKLVGGVRAPMRWVWSSGSQNASLPIGIGEPAAPEADLAAGDALVGVEQRQLHRGAQRGASRCRPRPCARRCAAGCSRMPSIIWIQPNSSAEIEAATGEDDGLELGAGHLDRHRRLLGQGVGDGPLARSRDSSGRRVPRRPSNQGCALIQSSVARPSSRSWLERVELALGFAGAAAGLDARRCSRARRRSRRRSKSR